MKKIKTKLIKVFVVLGFIFLIFGTASPALAAYSASNLVTLTNAERTKSGLGSLSVNSALVSAATAKANDMIAKNYFAHTSPDGRTPWDFIKGAGYDYSYAGENLAIGYSDASELMSAWMASPTHKENILNSNFRDIGIAVVAGKYNGLDTIVVAQEFGTPAAEQVTATAGETHANPTPTPSASVSAPTFNILQDKSSFTPSSIFAGEDVNFNVVVTGAVKTLEIQIGDQKINLLESGSASSSGDEKTYALKQKLEKVGLFNINVTALDQNGNSKTVVLGQIEVKATVIAKEAVAQSGRYAGFKGSLQKYWFLYVLGIALVSTAVVYVISHKMKVNRFTKLGLASWDL